METEKTKVAIIGSGNWGTAMARIIGCNVSKLDNFDKTIKMYVFEEVVDGKNLSEIINTQHENVKYLPGYKIPPNVVAVTNVIDTCKDADVLIFVLPHKFIRGACEPLCGKIKQSAIGVSLVKGFDIGPEGKVELISKLIHNILKIDIAVLMGANLAGEVADEKFCEATIGCKDNKTGKMLKELIETDYFRLSLVDDVHTVEICGALKNIVACGAGFVDGLKYGDNTKAAVIRLGLMEMIEFGNVFYPGAKLTTFFESCGIADLITTCYGGRNRRVAEAFVKTGKSIEELEKEMLGGQRMQGHQTAEEVAILIEEKKVEKKFPLFYSIHRICRKDIPPTELINCIRHHPAHHVK